MPDDQVKPCKDCLEEFGSPELVPARRMTDKNGHPFPGPRCYTHHVAFNRGKKKRAHASRVNRVYKGWGELYSELKEFQGGTCAICQRARGVSRNLSVDHDHKCCPGKESCGTCVRGLLCTRCNDLLGHARDDIYFFSRAMEYLNSPPAKKFIEERSKK